MYGGGEKVPYIKNSRIYFGDKKKYSKNARLK